VIEPPEVFEGAVRETLTLPSSKRNRAWLYTFEGLCLIAPACPRARRDASIPRISGKS
jgi:hypothetical protein